MSGSGNKKQAASSSYEITPNSNRPVHGFFAGDANVPSIEWDDISQQLIACFKLFQGSAATNQEREYLCCKVLPLRYCATFDDLLINAIEAYGRVFPQGEPPVSAIKLTAAHLARTSSSESQYIVKTIESDYELHKYITELTDHYKSLHRHLSDNAILQDFETVPQISLTVQEGYLDVSRQSTFKNESRVFYARLYSKSKSRAADPPIPAKIFQHVAPDRSVWASQHPISPVRLVDVPDLRESRAGEAASDLEGTREEFMQEVIRLREQNSSLRDVFWTLANMTGSPEQTKSLDGFLRIMEQYEKDKREPEKEIENLMADKMTQKKFFEAQMIDNARKVRQLTLEKNIEATNRQMADRELATARKVMNGEQLTTFGAASEDKIHYNLQIQKVHQEKAKVEAELYHANTLLRRQQKTIDYWQWQFGPHLPDNCD